MKRIDLHDLALKRNGDNKTLELETLVGEAWTSGDPGCRERGNFAGVCLLAWVLRAHSRLKWQLQASLAFRRGSSLN